MYQKVFSATLDSLYDMLEFIQRYGEQHHMPSLAIDQMVLAAEEALVNIISYGYPDDKKGIIDITCESASSQPGVKMIIKDQGIPFNPIEKAPIIPSSPNVLDEAEATVGGYGIYILIGLMDKVEYQRQEDLNLLCLIKYL